MLSFRLCFVSKVHKKTTFILLLLRISELKMKNQRVKVEFWSVWRFRKKLWRYKKKRLHLTF